MSEEEKGGRVRGRRKGHTGVIMCCLRTIFDRDDMPRARC